MSQKSPTGEMPILENSGTNIVLFTPNIPTSAIGEIEDTLSSRWIGQGPKVEIFESEFSKRFMGQKPCLSVNSGTSALHLSYIAAGLQEGDEVLCPVFTCTATNIPLLYLKVKLIFVDIDPETLNMSITDLKNKITDKSRAIVVVNYGGLPANMDEINNVAQENSLIVINDNAHALGAKYKNQEIGLTSDFSMYSFQAIKHITTGDGGMIGLNSTQLDKKNLLKRVRWFGIDRESKQNGIWENDIKELGYKYQMTDIAACLGISALKIFDSTLSHRITLLNRYEHLLSDNPDVKIIAKSNSISLHAAWLFTIRIKNRRDLQKLLRENRIESNQVHFRNDKYSIFQNYSNAKSEFPNMDEIEDEYLVLPLHTKMNENDVDRICEVIKNGW
jgi:dTDP-4-amino-4,6-dideoxygalactose transaminase